MYFWNTKMKVTAISLASLTIIIVSLVIGVKNIHHKAGLTTSLVQITSQIALNKRCISLANQYWRKEHSPQGRLATKLVVNLISRDICLFIL